MPLQNARPFFGGRGRDRANFTRGRHGGARRLAGWLFLLGLIGGPGRTAAGAEPAGPPPVRMAVSDPKTAVEAYDLGAALLETGDVKGAEAAFKKSGELAAKLGINFAPPHEGMARVMLRKNKLAEADFEARTATELDPAWLRGWWVLAKVAEREENEELALTYYERGLVIDPTDEELGAGAIDLLNRLGRPQGARALEERQRDARNAANRRGTGGRPASAGPLPPPPPGLSDAPAPGSAASPAPSPAADPFTEARRRLRMFVSPEDLIDDPALLAVLAQPVLTRGALAVLITGSGQGTLARALDGEAGVLDGSYRTPSDVGGRPEAFWINRALSLDFMDTLPDGTFRPDQPVTRQTLALWAEDTIARLRGNSKVFSLYRGSTSPFTDLSATHYAYNAARIAVDLNMLAPAADGRFGLGDPVSMEEGVTALRNFVPALAGQEAR